MNFITMISNTIKNAILFVLLHLIIVIANGQSLAFRQANALHVGNYIPNIGFLGQLNGNSIKGNIADYKGKLIILDFWATWCSPCVAALPKMEELQQQFKDSLQIIAITSDNTNMVQSFFKKNNVSLPGIVFIAGDTIFSKYIYYKFIPHEVWIDDRSNIIAMTTAEYVNADNIRQVLKTGKADWPVKDEIYTFPFQTTSLFGLTPLAEKSIKRNNIYYSGITGYYYSGITGYIEGPGCSVIEKLDSAQGSQWYNIYNYPIIALYSMGYKGLPEFQYFKRCILNVKDSSKFIYNARKGEYRDRWEKKNWYSYEALIPLSYTKTQIQKKIVSDLDFFFQLHSSVEKRNIQCWILKSSDSLLQQKTIGKGLPQHALNIDNKGNYVYKQEADWISSLVRTINNDSWLYKLPLVIDETNYRKLVTLELHLGKEVSNINVWREQLKKFGFDLIPEEREMEMLILSEDNN